MAASQKVAQWPPPPLRDPMEPWGPQKLSFSPLSFYNAWNAIDSSKMSFSCRIYRVTLMAPISLFLISKVISRLLGFANFTFSSEFISEFLIVFIRTHWAVTIQIKLVEILFVWTFNSQKFTKSILKWLKIRFTSQKKKIVLTSHGSISFQVKQPSSSESQKSKASMVNS